ncbi:MAG TPA: alpha-hydroxy-acid oxidizing protein, partial [Candidatus Lustribacter sp.]
AGGTSWARVEGKRSGDDQREALAETFAGWGAPTAHAVRELRERFPQMPLIASGGVRTGVDIARALALGADLCGLALPFLEAASTSRTAVDELIGTLVEGLRIAMFATGSATVHRLRGALLD